MFEGALEKQRPLAATGADNAPPALLRGVSPLGHYAIYSAMARQGMEVAELSSWKAGRVVEKPKEGKRKDGMLGWRALTVVPAAAKLYEAVWWSTADKYLRPLGCPLGFRAGFQPMDLGSPIQVLLAKAAGWRDPLVVASLDVTAALHEMRPMGVAA